MAQGVMYDTAQRYYQVSFANQFGDATPTLHLFMSDDTPAPSDLPSNDYVELSNDSYAPVVAVNGQWSFFLSPTPGFYAITDAVWHLAPPDPGSDTIFGWWLDAPSTRLGFAEGMFGGRFPTAVIIPPAGMTLTLAEVQLPLHDCGYPPPPPPAVIDVLAIYFPNTGISLNASAPQIGAAWSVVSGAWNGQAEIETLSDSGSASINLAVIDTGAGDGVLDTFVQVPFSGGVGFVARLSDAANYWRCYADRATAKIYLDKIVAGVSTTVNSSAASVGGGSLHKINLVMSGNNLTLTWDNAVSINTGGDSFNETATKHGLYAGIGAAAAVFYYTARP